MSGKDLYDLFVQVLETARYNQRGPDYGVSSWRSPRGVPLTTTEHAPPAWPFLHSTEQEAWRKAAEHVVWRDDPA